MSDVTEWKRGDPVWFDERKMGGKVLMVLANGYILIQLTNGDTHRVPEEILRRGGFLPCAD